MRLYDAGGPPRWPAVLFALAIGALFVWACEAEAHKGGSCHVLALVEAAEFSLGLKYRDTDTSWGTTVNPCDSIPHDELDCLEHRIEEVKEKRERARIEAGYRDEFIALVKECRRELDSCGGDLCDE